jgi:hypothetical protein
VSDWWTDKVRWFVVSSPLLDRRPCFHQARPFDEAEIDRDETGQRIMTTRRTVCGRILSQYGGGKLHRDGTPALVEHARLIGVPCSQCFPRPVGKSHPIESS